MHMSATSFYYVCETFKSVAAYICNAAPGMYKTNVCITVSINPYLEQNSWLKAVNSSFDFLWSQRLFFVFLTGSFLRKDIF